MTADSIWELRAFAQNLGISTRYLHQGRHPHYDLTEGMMQRAVAAGAIPTTTRLLTKIAGRLSESTIAN